MIFLKTFIKRNLLIFSIVLGVVVLGHIILTLSLNNVLIYETISMYTFGVISLSVIILVILTLIQAIRTNSNLYKYLLKEVDPKKTHEKIVLIENDVFNKKSKIALKLLKVSTLFRLGEFSEALDIVSEDIHNFTENKMHIILWNHNKVMMSIALRKDVEILQNEFVALGTKYTKKVPVINMFLEAQNMYKNIFTGMYDGVENYYIDEIEVSLSVVEKVSYNNNLSKMYFRQGRLSDAKKCIQYIIQNGNTMYAVVEAKELLERIEGKI